MPPLSYEDCTQLEIKFQFQVDRKAVWPKFFLTGDKGVTGLERVAEPPKPCHRGHREHREWKCSLTGLASESLPVLTDGLPSVLSVFSVAKSLVSTSFVPCSYWRVSGMIERSARTVPSGVAAMRRKGSR